MTKEHCFDNFKLQSPKSEGFKCLTMHPPASASACLESWLVSTVRSPEKLRFPLVKYDQEAWKPGSTCLFSLQFCTSAFNVNVTWSAFLSQEIRIYLNLRRRADHEIALPAAVDLDGCFAYPSGRREDADRHVQTCNTNRFLSISPTEWEGMKASNELEATQNAWRCFTAREWHPLWLMFTAWPSPPGGIW